MSEQTRCRSDTSNRGEGARRTLRSIVSSAAGANRRRLRGQARMADAAASACLAMTSRARLLAAVIVIAIGCLMVLAVFGLHEHAHLLKDAFVKPTSKSGTGPAPTCTGPHAGGASCDTSGLVTDVNNLSTDSLYVLGPTVTLAGAVGAIFWAAGHRRGPSIMGGAVAAGVLGASIKLIVN